MRWMAWAAAAVAMAGAWAEAATASPGSGRTAVVALGDSFISGEGGRWLGNGTEPFGARSGTDRAAFDCVGAVGRRVGAFRESDVLDPIRIEGVHSARAYAVDDVNRLPRRTRYAKAPRDELARHT